MGVRSQARSGHAIGIGELAGEVCRTLEAVRMGDVRDRHVRFGRVDEIVMAAGEAPPEYVLGDRCAVLLEQEVEVADRDADRRGNPRRIEGRVVDVGAYLAAGTQEVLRALGARRRLGSQLLGKRHRQYVQHARADLSRNGRVLTDGDRLDRAYE